MRRISRIDADKLREQGLGEFVKMSGKTHKSRAKRYYIVECRKALQVLEE